MKISSLIILGAGLGVGFVSQSSAALSPDHVRVADQKKTQAYLKDGLFVGGDAAISDVVVRDIRRATNAGYERLVIDLEGNQAGSASPLARPPYYQVAVSPDERRLVFTVYGNSKLGFDAKKVVQSFTKSQVVQSIDLLPRLEPDQWTFALNLKAGAPAEVFELTSPLRVIIDLKSEARAAPPVAAAKIVRAKTVRVAHAQKTAASGHPALHSTAKAIPQKPEAQTDPAGVDPIPAESLEKAEGLLQKELEQNIPKAPGEQVLDPIPGETSAH